MRRGAFTLVETMIVVLIVTAISAIFLPSIAARVTDGRIGHATRSIEAGAALAAAEAMERSTIIAYVAEQWRDEWVLWAEEVDPGQIGTLLRPAERGLGAAPEDRGAARHELASFEGVRLTDTLPPALDELLGPEPIDDSAGPLSSDPGGGDRGDAGRDGPDRFVLAVFFADGTCRAGPKMYLVADDGRREAFSLGPLTGRVETRRLPTTSEELSQSGRAGEGEPPLRAPEDARAAPGGGP